MIACMHQDKDWEGENAPRILYFINKAQNSWNSHNKTAPHDIIGGLDLSKHSRDFGETIPVEDFRDKRIFIALERKCQIGLLWGLANPARFQSWYESDYKKGKEVLPTLIGAGLKVDAIPTLSELLKESDDMVDGYEREIGRLPEIPSKLLADALSLGIEIK